MTNGLNPTIQLQPGAEAVLTAVAQQQFLTPQAYRLQLAASHMLLIGGFDELICLNNLNFEPFPYQIKAAHAALRRFRGRGMDDLLPRRKGAERRAALTPHADVICDGTTRLSQQPIHKSRGFCFFVARLR
mgnify:CR=1 FL=1